MAPTGARKCALHLKACNDDNFVSEHLGADDAPDRKIIYEDPDFGFCIWRTSTVEPNIPIRTIMDPAGQFMVRRLAKRR